MKKLILFFALAFTASAAEPRSVYFLTGFNVNEHCFFAHSEKEYAKVILHNINLLSKKITQKEAKELLNVLNSPTSDYKENFIVCKKIRNTVEIILSKEKNLENWTDYVFGVLLSEIAIYKSVYKPVKDYMPLLKIISDKFLELNRKREATLVAEIVDLENKNELTIQKFSAIAKNLILIYGEGLKDEFE